MDDLNNAHPTSNLDNWALNQLGGFIPDRGINRTPLCSMSFTLLIWLCPFFTASYSDWLFGLGYNSCSVSHTHWHKRCAHRQQNALVITGKAQPTAPRGRPRASGLALRWILKIKTCSDPEQIIRPHISHAASDHDGSTQSYLHLRGGGRNTFSGCCRVTESVRPFAGHMVRGGCWRHTLKWFILKSVLWNDSCYLEKQLTHKKPKQHILNILVSWSGDSHMTRQEVISLNWRCHLFSEVKELTLKGLFLVLLFFFIPEVT